jgi:hypothetical protein
VPGIDLLVSRRFSRILKDSLDNKIFSKLEREMFLQDGMSIKLSIENYDVFQKMLRKYHKNDYQKFQDDSISEILSIKYLKGKYSLDILDEELCEKVFDYFGDSETRKILSCIMGKKLTVSEILSVSNVLKSPAYRKIENLLLDGLILESGKILTKNKRVSQYSCVFEEIRFAINNKKLSVECIVPKKILEESSIFSSGLLNTMLVS